MQYYSQKNKKFKMNKLNSALLALLVPLAMSSVAAEQVKGNEQKDDTETIVVSGIRGSLVSSLQNKRFESSVVDGIAAEDIGKFPDQNVAESLQRITGVTIDRSAGEGKSISIRGFGPEFNSVLLNQRTVPTDSGGRAFSFDLLAAEMIAGADVYKTSKASMTEGSIGGLVNIKTAKPLDIEGVKVAGNVKTVYDTLAESNSPSISALYSQNIDDKLGLLASFAYQQRDARQDRAFVGGYREDFVIPGSDPTGPTTSEKVWRPQSAGQNYNVQDRERLGANLVAQWAASEDLVLTADVMFSKLTVDDKQSELARWFSNPLINAQVDENNTVQSFSRIPKPYVAPGVFQLWQDGSRLGTGQWNSSNLKMDSRDVETTMVGLNIDWTLSDALSLEVDVQTSTAQSRSGDNAQVTLANPTQGITNFALSGDSFSWQGQDIDFAATPDLYHANNVRFVSSDRDDDITELRADIEWIPEDLGVVESIRGGIYYSDREKVSNNAETNFANVVSAFRGFHYNAPSGIMNSVSPDDGLLSSQGGFVNSWFDYNPQDLVDFFMSDAVKAQADSFGAQILNNFQNGDPTYATLADAQVAADAASAGALAKIAAAQAYAVDGQSGNPLGAFAPEHNAGNSWVVTEQTTALYVQADLAGEDWSGNIGLRYVTTDTESFGNGNDLVAINVDTAGGSATLNVLSGQDVSASSSYSKILPSLNLKYEVNEDVVARFAYSETLTRPQMSQLTPAIAYSGGGVYDANNEIDFDGSVVSQNVDLKPYTSVNFDLALEWYYSADSYVGLAYFYKDINDWITTQTNTVSITTPSIVDGVAGGDLTFEYEKTAPQNTDSSDASGIEFAVLHNFDNGFGVQFNYTYMDSSAAFTPGQENLSFTLDGLSKDSFNLVTYYEQGPLQARLAYNWRSDYVNCATCSRSSQPVQTEAYGQFDASASYDITDELSIFVEGVNITDEDTRQYSIYESRFLSYVDSGARLSVGIRGTF